MIYRILLLLCLVFPLSAQGPADPMKGIKRISYQELCEKAKDGDSRAQFTLGLLLCEGDKQGVPRNKAEGRKWLLKAAEQGNWLALMTIGVNYELGDSGPESRPEAITWYQKAADLGCPQAQFLLSTFYSEGRLVEQNLERADALCLSAAELGLGRAQVLVAKQYAKGIRVPVDLDKAFSFYKKAAMQGEEEAQKALGEWYLNGYHVPVDYQAAYYWFYLALDHRWTLANKHITPGQRKTLESRVLETRKQMTRPEIELMNRFAWALR